MPVETLQPSDGRMVGAPFTSAMPFRILNKGPDYFRRPAEPGARKLSAVERLEADKAKYVKSQQVASTRQEPVKPPVIRKPLLSPSMMLQCRVSTPPARKALRRPGDRRGAPLNLDILNNLINVSDSPPAAPSPASSPSQRNGHLHGTHSSSSSSSSFSPLARQLPEDQNRRPPPIPARAIAAGVTTGGSPSMVTVRRVDVRPHAELRKTHRAQQQVPTKRLLPQPQLQVAQPQAPPPLASVTSSSATQTQPQAPPSLAAPSTPPSSLAQPFLPSSPLLLHSALPPASPAFTRLSSASSRGSTRKHPSLHRSKSDLSDRYSRATADLERFFNYCGLDPEEVEGMGVERFARASSDIVSVSKLRSVSTPSSECAGPSQHSRQGADEDEEALPSERVPYGISVIERNARVIKWLYGIRQARDAHTISNV